ncbi:hypothetical protein [Virgibacillus sp. SK37]|uniref:hypothetical protein n=1 Tax=Virgibacillus sp. SK37 TaxID=403957 RepID=UPI0004D14E53|nr:hypothetical protein [Virgibacillus sp. SK37]AIF45338.1 hypothetical protein X953_07360 [Virgibacillus sp. SK37]
MEILRLAFFRFFIVCVVILTLLFTNNLGPFTFFIIAGGFSLVEAILSKRKFDRITGNKLLDFGWILFVIITVAAVLIYSGEYE